MADWRKALLQRIGAKPTKQNLRFLDTWQRWEGGHTNNDARFNWLNTTKDAPGAVASINSVGVKRFDTFHHGIDALAGTLQNGRYDDLVAGLVAGNPYKFDVSAGLQTWVSGSPTGNPGYAAKVLGGKASSVRPPSPAGAPPSPRYRPGPQPGGDGGKKDWDFAMDLIFNPYEDAEMNALMKGIPEYDVARADPGPTHHEHDTPGGGQLRANGKTLQPGTSWKGSHVTDGLDWNGGQQTAVDIMAHAGTTVVAPESGRVLRHGSAQGGQAMYFMSDSGHLYWLGHIDSMIPVGTRVKKGGKLALISADHDAPHLHIDRYYGKEPGRYT